MEGVFPLFAADAHDASHAVPVGLLSPETSGLQGKAGAFCSTGGSSLHEWKTFSGSNPLWLADAWTPPFSFLPEEVSFAPTIILCVYQVHCLEGMPEVCYLFTNIECGKKSQTLVLSVGSSLGIR